MRLNTNLEKNTECLQKIKLASGMSAWVFIEGREYYYKPSKNSILDTLEKKYKYEMVLLKNPTFGNEEPFSFFSFGTRSGVKYIRSNFVGYFCDEEIYISLPKITDDRVSITDPSEVATERSRIYAKEFEQLLKLLYRYGKYLAKKDSLFSTMLQDPANELSIAQRLGEHYLRCGLYTVSETDTNYHSGVSLWGKTVTKVTPDIVWDPSISSYIPIYPRVIKKRFRREESDITEIQKAVLKHFFYEENFSAILQIWPDVENSLYNFEQLKGSERYIQRLSEELIRTFDEDNREMLELLIQALSAHSSPHRRRVHAILKYDILFEAMLGDYFKNQLSLWNRGKHSLLNVSFTSNYHDIKLIRDINADDIDDDKYNLIKWNLCGIEAKRVDNYNIFIPDVVFDLPELDQCVIIDAKYYNIRIEGDGTNKKLCGYPGKDDILKQIHYKEIFQKIYMNHRKHPNITNIFVVPLSKSVRKAMCSSSFKHTSDKGMLSYIGRISVDYKYEEKDILVIAVDVNSLVPMLLSGQNNVAVNRGELLTLIESIEENQPQ